MPTQREKSFSEYLDHEKENKLFVKFVFSNDYKNISEFVVSQISIINGKPTEIIRFDCSLKERANVHRFYLNPPEKHYLMNNLSFDTVEIFMKRTRDNWREYRMKFIENYNL